MDKLVSIDLKADFGFLRKPDTNEGISLSYNMLHKPALLGIFGAVLGLRGYRNRGELPEYYEKLQGLKVGVAPLGDDKGNFGKTTIIYTNTVGYANKDGNFIAYESTLIRPSYRVFVALSKDDPLYAYLKRGHTEYLPYLGKNEFPIWWEPNSFQEYDKQLFEYDHEYTIRTLFRKNDNDPAKRGEANSSGFASFLSESPASFFYFERLPIAFKLFHTTRGLEYQYDLAPFVYSNAQFSPAFRPNNLYTLNDKEVVQLN